MLNLLLKRTIYYKQLSLPGIFRKESFRKAPNTSFKEVTFHSFPKAEEKRLSNSFVISQRSSMNFYDFEACCLAFIPRVSQKSFRSTYFSKGLSFTMFLFQKVVLAWMAFSNSLPFVFSSFLALSKMKILFLLMTSSINLLIMSLYLLLLFSTLQVLTFCSLAFIFSTVFSLFQSILTLLKTKTVALNSQVSSQGLSLKDQKNQTRVLTGLFIVPSRLSQLKVMINLRLCTFEKTRQWKQALAITMKHPLESEQSKIRGLVIFSLLFSLLAKSQPMSSFGIYV